MKKGKAYIGTSGWMYKHWHESFYPKTLKKDFLTFYSQKFKTVEINNSFYRIPNLSVFEKWKAEVTKDFVFAVKLNRSITHVKKLRNDAELINAFLKNAKGLGNKLGPILIQLPPSSRFHEEVLADFLETLRKSLKELKLSPRLALEPRHPSWFGEEKPQIMRILKRFRVAAVFAHSSRFPFYDFDRENLTANFVYLRLHGPQQFAGSLYGEKRLVLWAKAIKKWLKEGKDVYAYFNNDVHEYAIDDVEDLIRLVGGK